MAKNKVVYNGQTLIDLTDTTATAADVASGKYFYTNAGVRTQGTASGSSVSMDTKTATASSYPVTLSFTGMKGKPKMFACHSTSQISSSVNTTYYYVTSFIMTGEGTAHGNCFRIGSTRRTQAVTSGYTWSYSGTTLTLTSSAASRSAAPGAFNNTYELTYVY